MKKESNIYVLNPNYRLLDDIKRVLLIAVDTEKAVPNIEYSTDFYTIIHPLHAQILTFFDGKHTYKEVIEQLKLYLKIEEVDIKEFVDRLIENKPFKLLSQGHIINYPLNVLVPLANKALPIITYSPSYFPLIPKVDLVTQRLYKPKYFSIILTMQCYTNCIYCYADRRTKNYIPLPTTRIIELIDEMIALDAIKIDFDGGEILLHPDSLKILSYTISKGYMPYISTKCPLNKEKVQALKHIGINKIQISLDSSDINTLHSLLGVSENYLNQILDTISYCESENIEVVIHDILTSYNSSKEKVEALIKRLLPFKNIKEINIDPVGYSLFKNSNDFSKIRISERQLIEIQNMVKEKQSIYVNHQKNVKVKDTKMLCRIYNNPQTKQTEYVQRPKCEGNVSALFILPDGKVTICEELYWHPQFILGDVNTHSIMEVWNSSQAMYLTSLSQKDISENSACKKCTVFNACRGININRTCWKEVQYFYGKNNWDYPQPSCPYAPPALTDCLMPE